MSKDRKFPLKFKHKESKGEVIARDEVQAAAFEKLGFEEVKESKKDKE